MSNRYLEPGWQRIGRIDHTGRRSLWMREYGNDIELCAGREGDDAYIRITNEQWPLMALLEIARFAAEFEDPDGMTLDREEEALAAKRAE